MIDPVQLYGYNLDTSVLKYLLHFWIGIKVMYKPNPFQWSWLFKEKKKGLCALTNKYRPYINYVQSKIVYKRDAFYQSIILLRETNSVNIAPGIYLPRCSGTVKHLRLFEYTESFVSSGLWALLGRGREYLEICTLFRDPQWLVYGRDPDISLLQSHCLDIAQLDILIWCNPTYQYNIVGILQVKQVGARNNNGFASLSNITPFGYGPTRKFEFDVHWARTNRRA